MDIYCWLKLQLQMSDQFRKEQQQNTTNALGHLGMVQNLAREADKDLQQYHKLIELFRQELESMKSRIHNINDEIHDTTTPLIEAVSRNLEAGMVNQRDENSNFQDQLTELKKEKSVLSQMITATFKRTELLNEEVGHY